MKPSNALLAAACLALGAMSRPLHAQQRGGVQALRDVELRQGEREIRFRVEIGLGIPDRTMVIRQRGDSVAGELLLMWGDSIPDDPYIAEICGERWKSPQGVLCRGKFRLEPEWRTFLGLLDSLGMADMPASPVRAESCPPTSSNRVCALMADGIHYALEVRTPGHYWFYAFEEKPDKTSAGLKRDAAIFELLRCAARIRGEGPRCDGATERAMLAPSTRRP